jgi:hypothetical protein
MPHWLEHGTTLHFLQLYSAEVLLSTGGTPCGKGLSVYSEPTGTLTGQSHYRTQQLIVEQ